MSTPNGDDLLQAQSPEGPNSSGKRRRGPKPAYHPGSPQTPPAKRDMPAQRPAAAMTVLVHRVDLYDSGRHNSFSEDNSEHRLEASPGGPNLESPRPPRVEPYSYIPPSGPVATAALPPQQQQPAAHGSSTPDSVAVSRVPQQPVHHANEDFWMQVPVMDRSIPNPFSSNITKYWNQRRRLFSRFDQGIQLDEEGWFSVTPEQIADHVASRFEQLMQQHQNHHENQPITLLDAFCGCGGNAMAFAKLPNVTVIGVDVDRTKLRRAAHNAAIYQIPPHKIAFVECNVLFILEYCFKNGHFMLDQPLECPHAAAAMMAAMPPPVPTETCCGYQVGGIDMLPRSIDAVFMDPPWGGVDYKVLGKNGYDLQRNMRIQRPVLSAAAQPEGALVAGFFDSFGAAPPRSKQDRKAQFNSALDEEDCVNGTQLLALAAGATQTRWVIYDVPRNINRSSLGLAALAAGYRGNCKLEEHYLNGRLKTATAYFGCDWSFLVPDGGETSQTNYSE